MYIYIYCECIIQSPFSQNVTSVCVLHRLRQWVAPGMRGIAEDRRLRLGKTTRCDTLRERISCKIQQKVRRFGKFWKPMWSIVRTSLAILDFDPPIFLLFRETGLQWDGLMIVPEDGWITRCFEHFLSAKTSHFFMPKQDESRDKEKLVGGLNPSEKYEFVNWDD